MKVYITFLASLIFSYSLIYPCTASSYQSKRIEVYAISQSFWDVQPGDTLGQIVIQLLPDNPQRRNSLMREILQLNRNAFIDSNPNRLKANVRLWLPDQGQHSSRIKDNAHYHIQTFSWGELYTPKR